MVQELIQFTIAIRLLEGYREEEWELLVSIYYGYASPEFPVVIRPPCRSVMLGAGRDAGGYQKLEIKFQTFI